MIIAVIVIANVALFVLSRRIRRREDRRRIFDQMQRSASTWQWAGWIPIEYSFDGKKAVLTMRWCDSDQIELLVIQ